MAHVEERTKQEFAAGMGAVLRIGSYGIIVSADYCLFGLEKARDRTLILPILSTFYFVRITNNKIIIFDKQFKILGVQDRE